MTSSMGRVLDLGDKEPWVGGAPEGTQRIRAVFSVAGGVRLFPAGTVASSEEAKSYLEGGVSVVGEVAEAYWGRTGTCSENGGENPRQLPAPALTSPGQRRLEDMAAVRKMVSSERKGQRWLCGGQKCHGYPGGLISRGPLCRSESTPKACLEHSVNGGPGLPGLRSPGMF